MPYTVSVSPEQNLHPALTRGYLEITISSPKRGELGGEQKGFSHDDVDPRDVDVFRGGTQRDVIHQIKTLEMVSRHTLLKMGVVWEIHPSCTLKDEDYD
jgi:hypothetical protein